MYLIKIETVSFYKPAPFVHTYIYIIHIPNMSLLKKNQKKQANQQSKKKNSFYFIFHRKVQLVKTYCAISAAATV